MTEAPVSRETPPAVVDELFPGRGQALRAYADKVAGDGVVRGLIGPREVPRLWERHLLNCAVVAEVVPPGSTLADVGSGAGLPGLVWSIVRPDLRVTLVEPLLRRTAFLEEAIGELGLDNVTVLRSRAEDLHGQHRFDVVTARAVAPLTRLARWCVPLVRPGGSFVALKGASIDAEVREAREVLEALGCNRVQMTTFGAGVLRTPSRVVLMSCSGRPAHPRTMTR